MNRIRAGVAALLLGAVLSASGCSFVPDDTELSIRSLSITHFYGPAGQPAAALGRQQVMAIGNLLTVAPVAPVDARGRPYHHSELSLVVIATSRTYPAAQATQRQFQSNVEQGHCLVDLPGIGVLPVSEGAQFPDGLDLPAGRQAKVWLSAMPAAKPETATLRCALTSNRVAGVGKPVVRTASFTIEFR